MVTRVSDSSYRSGIKTIIVSILMIGTIAIGTLMYHKYFEYTEVEETYGFSATAIQQPLLAAKKYLTEFGYQVEPINRLDFFGDLPPTHHTIVLRTLPAELPDSYYNKLTQWIKDGGHLIAGVGFGHLEESVINFLAEFNITAGYIQTVKNENYVVVSSTIKFPGDKEPLSIENGVTFPLNLQDNNTVFGIPYGDQYLLAQISVDEGHLTLASNFQFFSNWSIGENDHALLLSRIVESTDSKVLWVNDNFKDFKGLYSLIWENYRWLVLVLTALLLLWLRHASVRLGPLEIFPDSQSNNFAQHLLAVSRFHFRHGNTQQLLAPTREKIIQSLTAGKSGSDEEIVKQVASRSKLSQKQVQHALFGNTGNHATLTAATTTLRQLMLRKSRQRH